MKIQSLNGRPLEDQVYTDIELRVIIEPNWDEQKFTMKAEARHPETDELLWYQEEEFGVFVEDAAFVFGEAFKIQLSTSELL